MEETLSRAVALFNDGRYAEFQTALEGVDRAASERRFYTLLDKLAEGLLRLSDGSALEAERLVADALRTLISLGLRGLNVTLCETWAAPVTDRRRPGRRQEDRRAAAAATNEPGLLSFTSTAATDSSADLALRAQRRVYRLHPGMVALGDATRRSARAPRLVAQPCACWLRRPAAGNGEPRFLHHVARWLMSMRRLIRVLGLPGSGPRPRRVSSS